MVNTALYISYKIYHSLKLMIQNWRKSQLINCSYPHFVSHGSCQNKCKKQQFEEFGTNAIYIAIGMVAYVLAMKPIDNQIKWSKNENVFNFFESDDTIYTSKFIQLL